MIAEDPDWPRASSWLASGAEEEGPTHLALLGVPLNRSLTIGHVERAPFEIRKALDRLSAYDTEERIDLGILSVRDYGDLDLKETTAQEAFDRSSEAVAALPATGIVLLGGDNGITLAGVCSLGHPLERCGLLTFDAHHDVRTTEHGSHNGNPVRALLEGGLPGNNIVQVGIQPFANSRAYSEFARESGITIMSADDVHRQGIDAIVAKALAHLAHLDAIYVDLDVDVLDRAFAPACPGARPGGLMPWMMRRAARLCGKAPSVKIMDIVEIDPAKDLSDTTVLAAASFLLAFASGLAMRLKL